MKNSPEIPRKGVLLLSNYKKLFQKNYKIFSKNVSDVANYKILYDMINDLSL